MCDDHNVIISELKNVMLRHGLVTRCVERSCGMNLWVVPHQHLCNLLNKVGLT